MGKEKNKNTSRVSIRELLFSHNIFRNLSIELISTKSNIIKINENQEELYKINSNIDFYQITYKPIIDVLSHQLTDLSNYFIKYINSHTLDEVSKRILLSDYPEIKSGNIPQFGNYDRGSTRIVEILHDSGNIGPDFKKIGYYLLGHGGNDLAYYKYGENHAKLAELMDLSFITHESPRRIYLSELGFIYYQSEDMFREKLAKIQILKIPIIHKIIKENIVPENYLNLLCHYLAPTTAMRRLQNIRTLLDIVKKDISFINVSN